MVGIEIVALSKVFDAFINEYRKINDELKVTLTKLAEVEFSYTELDSAETSNKDFDTNQPDLKFENPYKRECLVKEMSLIPDDEFKTSGMVEVYIGDEIVFKNKQFGNFHKISQSDVIFRGGTKIKPNESVRAFLKTNGGSPVGIALQVTFGD